MKAPGRLLLSTACAALLGVMAYRSPADAPRGSAPSSAASEIQAQTDSDGDGLPDGSDACPSVQYMPGFDWSGCGLMDLDPENEDAPECKARERVAHLLLNDGAFITNIAFSIVTDGIVHFADAYEYIGQGQWVHDPAGIHRLYRIGSTSKSLTAVGAKVMEEQGELLLADFVSDDDGTQQLVNGQRSLRHLLSHQGAFRQDSGSLHLFCYDGDLAEFWSDPDDLVSPHYDSATWGNLGGGFEYSAFNYSLAGAYLAHRAGTSFEEVIQTRVFDAAGMCTATLDGPRATTTPIGNDYAVSQGSVMHVGPYINQVSSTDPRCVDNFYSSDDLPGDPYTWQAYHLDEASAEARDPAGGVIASVIDQAHFAASLLQSYHGTGGLLSAQGVRDLWSATSDLDCIPNCPWERYYGIGFFTDSLPGGPITQVGHGGSRAGYTSAFVLRPETNLAVCILANADVSTVVISDLAKMILDDFEAAIPECPADTTGDERVDTDDFLLVLGNWGNCTEPCPPLCVGDANSDCAVNTDDFLSVLSAWGPCPAP